MVYSGNKLFNANNAVLLILMVFCGVMILGGAFYGGIAFFLIGIVITANEAFYFELTTNEFIVRNYILPFVNIKYNLTDIIEIELQDTNYRATANAGVKIYRDNKSSWAFRAASLGLQDWQNLVNDLSKQKIKVTVTSSRLEDKIGLPEN